MGKKSKPLDGAVPNMPIASAVERKDTIAMQSILLQALPVARSVEDVVIETTSGKAFTGGRSTPVYKVSGTVRKENGTAVRRSFVVKWVRLPDDKSEKTMTRRESYAVERRFYENAAIQERLRNAALTIPKVLASDRGSSFCILMNDLTANYPRHPDRMSLPEAAGALRWIATFHACFWGDSFPHVLWDRGAFWTQTCSVQGIAVAWVATHQFIESKYSQYVTSRTRTVGHRLQTAGPAIAHFLTEYAHNRNYRTVIHGDYKAANLFFDAENAAAIDFQYAGGGVGAEDVAYLIYPDAFGDWFGHEEMLLQIYHETLVTQLVLQRKGGPSTLPFETFLKFYELARLDMTRHWLCQGWIASTEGEAKLVGALERALDEIDGGSVLFNGDDDYKAALHRFVFGS
ncbi:hypothetical protein FisN_3Hh348 [Fistulifera solaris]|uniref:CHK kinase-like domain-containing protein n=1 Tax=Fistulifera solaris TaxID=1519565 RepID=A0A1Z5JQX0_FISSO|nr:hypothetical protein FisN_3Hh348 [Fistulifera solaris]|eukprot:GAX16171.1 hypothetical protein FisN_3Hh348 [Fistulifera solaris]